MARQTYPGIARTRQVFLSTLLLILCDPARAHAASSQASQVAYELDYSGAGDPTVILRITPKNPLPAPVDLVFPRSYPGGYSFVPYDNFVEDVHAFSSYDKFIECKKDANGPRWTIGQGSEVHSGTETITRSAGSCSRAAGHTVTGPFYGILGANLPKADCRLLISVAD